MKKASKDLIEATAEILNKHIGSNTPQGKALQEDGNALSLINEILADQAEGGRLVAAVETDGKLIGYVPRMSIPIPETPEEPPTHSRPAPDDSVPE